MTGVRILYRDNINMSFLLRLAHHHTLAFVLHLGGGTRKVRDICMHGRQSAGTASILYACISLLHGQ
jgi:hypothetical protein